VHVKSLEGVMRIDVSKDMWFYFAITAPLMAVTIGGWLLWDMKVRRAAHLQAAHRSEYGKFKTV